MRLLLSAIVAAGSFALATAAFTQSAPIRPLFRSIPQLSFPSRAANGLPVKPPHEE
jgi:hypothetical protein